MFNNNKAKTLYKSTNTIFNEYITWLIDVNNFNKIRVGSAVKT